MPTVSTSRVIDAPIDEVWRAIRDFGSHSRWIEHHPEIELEGGDGLTIGVKRRVIYGEELFFDEILTGMDDRKWVQEYDVIGDLPLPIFSVVGTMQLYPVGTSGTLVERRLSYDTPLSQDEAHAFAQSRVDLLATSLDLLADLFA
ncbi:hypothetical protein PS900_00672 [Pseudomonas fluorescens]|uniref:Polyketide cyclase n=1 Tax=Pseudomonas fluorescens TaxID=294 RepID=A0A8H2NNA3_PSEFL|nr:SRPBCC family protein [Pseudomonas fluorescens]VVO58476.1 hypothetical protein PS900_00672 [Pseudomonas fluorescens]